MSKQEELDEIGLFLQVPEGTPDFDPMHPEDVAKVEKAICETTEELLAAWDRGESLPFIDIAPDYASEMQKSLVEAMVEMPYGHPAIRHGPCVVAMEIIRLFTSDYPELGDLLRTATPDNELPTSEDLHMNCLIKQRLNEVDAYDADRRVYRCGSLSPHQEQIGVSMGVMFIKHGHKRLIQSAIKQNAVVWADNRDPVEFYRQWDKVWSQVPEMAN